MTNRWIAFGIVVLAVAGALVWSERRKVETTVGPEPILDFIGDTERELSRLPVKFVPLSDAEEIKIGTQLEKQYLPLWAGAGEDQARDRAIEAYLQEVGGRVAAHAHRKLPYRFHYIPSLDFVNAFSLPGGPVFIGGGLMALMDTEDELASVLAHEIEHIDHYHCAERVQIQAALERTPLGALAALPVEIFVAGYSKTQELEADREGARLAATALYSARGSIQMFQAFERFEPTKNPRSKTPQEELSQVALQTLNGYFRSHPLSSERIDQIQKMIAGGQLPDWQKTKPLAVAYVFLTERAWRSLQAAQPLPYAFLNDKDKRKREAERIKEFEEAIRLASQSLGLQSDQPRATEIVAIAHLGLGHYDKAMAAYQELLPTYPTFANGIWAYTITMARTALQGQLYEQARKAAQFSLQLQPNQSEGLKILCESQARLLDYSGADSSARTLKAVDSRGVAEVGTYVGRLAAMALLEKRYDQAARLAGLAVDLNPEEWEAVSTLAHANFARADFPGARDAYQKLLHLNPLDTTVIRGYADALSAVGRPSGDPGELLAHIHLGDFSVPVPVRVELAGVLLKSGDDRAALTLIAESRGDLSASITPELLGRLGWWYYRAGDYLNSAELLMRSIAQRPGDLALQASLGFDRIEQHQPDDAIRLFTLAVDDHSWNSPQMGRAVAHWQLRHREEALKDFIAVVKVFPEWQNPQWVGALYSPGVASNVREMESEQQKMASKK